MKTNGATCMSSGKCKSNNCTNQKCGDPFKGTKVLKEGCLYSDECISNTCTDYKCVEKGTEVLDADCLSPGVYARKLPGGYGRSDANSTFTIYALLPP